MCRLGFLVCVVVTFGCGDNADPVCEVAPFEAGGEGHPDPLGASAGEARAGRVAAADLPATGLEIWEAGDYVVANDRVALVIEEVGPSDHYDPWGGRPVGLARVVGGALVEPPDFGEFFILTARFSVVTDSVSVIADGSDGGAAIVRASGPQAPLPFYENLVSPLIRDDVGDIIAAVDYVLEPDSEFVDVFIHYRSPRDRDTEIPATIHGFIFEERMPAYAPGTGFSSGIQAADYIAFVDDDATSYTYEVPGQDLGSGISASGFTSRFTDGVVIEACGQDTTRHYARISIGGPGVDGALAARARGAGEALREITGVVRDAGGAPVVGARVHAESSGLGYVTRSRRTGADGTYSLHVPDGEAVDLTAVIIDRVAVGPSPVAASTATADFELPETGTIDVTATDADLGVALPVRVTIYASGASAIPSVPSSFGEVAAGRDRLVVDHAVSGSASIEVSAGQWQVVVSRGYEYELHEQVVDVPAGGSVDVTAALPHVVDTTGKMCADYHIHTHRSPDSPDDATEKLRMAVSDGLEIPVRSEHEFVAPFQNIVESLGLQDWAFAVTSVELTTMETFGHFGVIPLEPDPTQQNGGTPLWQVYPRAGDADLSVTTLSPPDLFAQVRARPEQPVIIVNHPRSGANYFEFVGYDPTDGSVAFPDQLDDTFRLVEVFNDSGWRSNFGGTVADWLSFLDSGRTVFAVGSSDSHRMTTSPVGYPRTCLSLGTDDPRQATPQTIRDATAAGNSIISGGIYLDVSVDGAGPGETVTPSPSPSIEVTVQAAEWISVDWIEVVVDGEVVDTIAVLPGDADPTNPVIRYAESIPISPGGTNSYVIVAAYGETELSPVHPGRVPFAVSNPILFD